MKKALVASILGLAVSAVSSHGQGSIWFDNYFNSINPIKWTSVTSAAPAGEAGAIVGSEISVELFYFLGDATQFSQLAPVPGAIVQIGAGHVVSDGNNVQGGYYAGGITSIPGFSSGDVTFALEAWNTGAVPGAGAGTASYTGASVQGLSPLFTEFIQTQASC